MKKCIKIISLIFVISIMTNLNYSCFANDVDTSIISDNFVSDLNPDGLNGTAEELSTPVVRFIHRIVNPILGFVQVIGGILTIVSVAMFGFGLFLNGDDKLAPDLGLGLERRPRPKGGPEARWELLDFGRSVLIGAVLLFSSATIVKFIFAVFNV